MNSKYSSKIALGTAQFGYNYGIANKNGRVKTLEIRKILKYAYSIGVDTIDTAQVYEDCEERLGRIGLRNFKVITKLPVTEPKKNIQNWVFDSFNLSLKKLRLINAYGLLVHNTSYLLDKKIGKELYNSLLKLKKKGKIEKIGISVHSIKELDEILNNYEMDIILAPFNVFDQRILKKNYLKKLRKKNIEIYTRSAFLQGLLIMKERERPKKFDRWKKLFNLWHKYLIKLKKSPIEVCLNFIFSIDSIDKTIIGVDNFSQFKQITNKRKLFKFNYKKFNSNREINLINPSKWHQI